MSGEVRARMAAGAAVLLAKRGLQATSFSGVLELTGTPRGSVYHHFPAGKDELVGAAIDAANTGTLAALDAMAGAPADEIAERFFGLWRMVLERSGFTAGCALLAVTVATDSAQLLDQAGTAFRTWRGRLGELLEVGGLDQATSAAFSATLIAASEGAVVMSRAEQSMGPFDLVARQLVDQVRAALGR